jgi:hypothetical protein
MAPPLRNVAPRPLGTWIPSPQERRRTNRPMTRDAHALDAGFDLDLAKPVRPDRLAEAVLSLANRQAI